MQLKTLVVSLMILLSRAPAASALPGMTASEVVNWSRSNSVIYPLRFTEKYESNYPDYDSKSNTTGGSIHFSVFLDNDELVETETIDYRPAYYGNSTSGYYGIVRFEKAAQSNGRNLIRAIWEQEILDDFLNSRLMETETSHGTARWYQGKNYNYETYHYNNYTISQFSIVSKKSSQPHRIKQYRYCLYNYC